MPKLKITCEAIAKTSGKRCRAKGYWTPTTQRFLCRFHRAGHSWDSKTRKYKGLFNNKTLSLQSKINKLKNLKNFKNKTDHEIKQYIEQETIKANQSKRYRTKYFTRSYLRWRNTSYRNKKNLADQLDEFLSVVRRKSKVQRKV